jgi:hypothetical protein
MEYPVRQLVRLGKTQATEFAWANSVVSMSMVPFPREGNHIDAYPRRSRA